MTTEGVERGSVAAPMGPDPSWSGLYRAGAVSAGLAVLMYVAALVIFVVRTPPPTAGGAAMLEYVDAHRTVYIVRQVLWVAPSLPLMVVFPPSLSRSTAWARASPPSWASLGLPPGRYRLRGRLRARARSL